MLNIFQLLGFTIFMLLTPAFAQESESSNSSEQTKEQVGPVNLILPPPKIENLPRELRSQVIKIAFDVILKAQQFKVILSSPKPYQQASIQFFSLNIDGKRVTNNVGINTYEVNIRLLNSINDFEIRAVSKSKIPERQIVFHTRKLLYKLFFDTDDTVTDLAFDINAELKRKKVKKKKNDEIVLDPPIVQPPPKEVDRDEPLAIPPVKPEPPKEKKDKKKEEEEEEKKKKEEKKEKEEKPKKIPENDKVSIPEDEPAAEEPPAPLPPPDVKVARKSIEIGVDYIRQSVESTSVFLTTTNNLVFFGPRMKFYYRANPYNENAYVAYLRLTRPLSDPGFVVNSLKQVGGGFERAASKYLPINFFIGLEYSTESFANIEQFANGVTGQQNSLIWFKLESSLHFSLGKRKAKLGGGIYSSFSGSSTYNEEIEKVNIDGSKVMFFTAIQVRKKYFLELEFSSGKSFSVNDNSLENSQTTILARLNYPIK